MWTVARHQMMEGFNDSRFVLASLIVLLAFILNGIFYSDKIVDERENWREIVNTNQESIHEEAANLQRLSDFQQPMTKPVSALSFVADDGPVPMVNTISVDAFTISEVSRNIPANEQLPFLPAFDWVLIVTTFMTVLCVLLSYGAICEEKITGTLRQVMCQPISRLSYFSGKFFGLLVTLSVVMIAGMLSSLLVLIFNDALTFSWPVVVGILWAVVFSVLLLSFFILLSMFVSSMVVQPRVSLIILLVTWILLIVILPGLASLFGEKLVEVPSRAAVERRLNSIWQALLKEHPQDAMNWSNDMKADFMPRRMALMSERRERTQGVIRSVLNLKIAQMKSISTLSWISPAGLYSSSLKEVSNTGVYGFETLIEYAIRYVHTFEQYVKLRDAEDADSAHLVYHTGSDIEFGTFSSKPVDPSTVPDWSGLWKEGGLSKEERWPAEQLLLMIAASIQVGLLSFWAFHRYDIR